MIAFRAAFIVGFILVSWPAEGLILGPGAVSCVTWSSDRQRHEAHSQLNQAWVLGFVTGYNVYKPPQQSMPRPVDSRAMMIWIDNYCDAHPDKTISDAAKALIQDLTARAR